MTPTPESTTATPAAPALGSIEDSLAEIKRFGNAFIRGAEGRLVTELRVPKVPRKYGAPRTESGFFDLLSPEGRKGFWDAIHAYLTREPDMQPGGVYLVMNVVDPVYLARACNRMGRTPDTIS